MLKTTIIIFKTGKESYNSLFLPFEEKEALATVSRFFDLTDYVLVESYIDALYYFNNKQKIIDKYKHELDD